MGRKGEVRRSVIEPDVLIWGCIHPGVQIPVSIEIREVQRPGAGVAQKLATVGEETVAVIQPHPIRAGCGRGLLSRIDTNPDIEITIVIEVTQFQVEGAIVSEGLTAVLEEARSVIEPHLLKRGDAVEIADDRIETAVAVEIAQFHIMTGQISEGLPLPGKKTVAVIEPDFIRLTETVGDPGIEISIVVDVTQGRFP